MQKFNTISEGVEWLFANSDYFLQQMVKELERMHENGDIEVLELTQKEEA